MLVLNGPAAASSLPAGGAVALGNFDGVHRGHQELVRRARAHAARLGGPSIVLTFDPHPSRVLAPARAPPLILPTPHRLDLLAGLGVDAVVLVPFTAELARVPADAFVRDVLAGALRAAVVVVGFNFTFGHGRAGTPALLHTLGAAHGFTVDVVDGVLEGGEPISSTRARLAIQQGDMAAATRLLGRPFAVRGTVVHGHHRGRTLGFPTANLAAHVELLPALGVYAARVDAVGGGPPVAHPAVVNVGTAPTFGGSLVTVEVHLLDADTDLYGRELEVAFVHRLRPEQRFDGIDALRGQIQADVTEARRLLAGPPA
ncbi:MAG: bifunctional riboflavin kinase/FAD synthetase [Deltaproteobacteria bacterium]|nr:bifunctional riboflavin kinase/FAD synthetase [Deltaproteobacteria bacterium]